jgi:hypothetical protein
MKKLAHLTMLLPTLLALASFALAQQKTPPQGQADQDKLVETVRNATTQYGELKLVGVEFILLASALPPNAAQQVEGHLMLYVDSPNRYGLPAFFDSTSGLGATTPAVRSWIGTTT